jgi:hypothetical protein
MTMQHRHEMRKKLQDFDLFLYAEDDVHVELRHVLAFYAESLRLAAAPEGRKYVLGWQRFEKNGIGARRRRDARRAGGGDRARRAGSRASRVDDAKRSAGLGAEQVMWENGVDSYHAVEVGGRLYATMVNPHAGAWMVRAAVVFLGPGERPRAGDARGAPAAPQAVPHPQRAQDRGVLHARPRRRLEPLPELRPAEGAARGQQGRKSERNSQLQRLLSRPCSTRFG